MTSRLSLLERLDARATENPDATAIIEPGGASFSRAQVAARTRALAHGFIAAGLVPGDRVLFAVRPSATAIALMTAIAESGGVLVPPSLGVGDAVFESQMRLVQPRWIVAESVLIAASFSAIVRRIARLAGSVLPSMESLRGARVVRVGLPIPWGPGAMSWQSVEESGAAHTTEPLPAIADEADAMIVFTSGTTAAPKAVVHNRRSLRATLDIVSGQLAIGERDTMLSRDLHLILPALFSGARVVISKDMRFAPERMLRMLVEHEVTHTFAVTADCQALLEHAIATGARLPESLRQILIGAAPVHATFLRRFHDIMPPNAKAWCVYGMTEMLPVASIELADKLAYEGEGDVVGTPVAGVVARVTDDGELVLRGPNLFTRYEGAPSVNEHATGDLARIDDGRIVLLGRLKDMIIRREHNIYPALHEPEIASIAGVRRCAMIGVFDDDAADERIVLFVEPEPWCDDDAFLQTLRRELRDGSHRIDVAAQPDLIIRTAIPSSGRSNKVDTDALRALARTRLTCASP